MNQLIWRAPHRRTSAAILVLLLGVFSQLSRAADLVHARDGSGVYGYKDTPILPWCGFKVHDPDRPAPPRVDPGPASASVPAPADAVVLFAGNNMDQWESNGWRIVEGTIEAGAGNLVSRESFGNMQLHLEWLAPAGFEGPWYDQGNNGVLLMGLYEIQIFDSYNEKLYPDGQAAAIYGQTPPLVNVTRPPGQWQTFDIIFTAPRWDGDQLLAAPRITMFHNNVLVHLEEEIRGETNHRVLPEFRRAISQGPVALAGHGCPVRFRNIWVRRL